MQNLLLFGGWQYPGDWAKSWKQWDSTRYVNFFFDWNVRNELWLLLKRMLTWFLSFLFLKGTLIRRHRIPLPPPNDEEFYTVENFNVGQEITLYSRTFKITVSISRYHWNTTSSIVIKTSHFLYELVIISPLLFQPFISHGSQVQNQADKWWG